MVWFAGDMAILVISLGACARAFGPLPYTLTFIFTEGYKISMMSLIGAMNFSAFVQVAVIMGQKYSFKKIIVTEVILL